MGGETSFLRAAELAQEAEQRPSDRHTDAAFVITAALQASRSLVSYVDFLPEYAAYLRELMKRSIAHPTNYDAPLTGFKIVVDPGNGGGAFIADQVLGPLGADVSGSINLEPDGSFPNHMPNPEDKQAVAATRAAVLDSNADLGIMLDTDVDRSGVVDRSGNGVCFTCGLSQGTGWHGRCKELPSSDGTYCAPRSAHRHQPQPLHCCASL
jgi:phosphomannomutase